MASIVADRSVVAACRHGSDGAASDNRIMTVCRAVPIVLSPLEYRVLTGRARRARGEQRDVLRARIVLAAAAGQSNAAIARRLAITEDTVRRWRARFATDRVKGLEDRPRPGRPRVFAEVAAAEVKAMACALPAETGVPLARWSASELAAEAVTRGVVDSVSASTVRRWLNADAIRPWLSAGPGSLPATRTSRSRPARCWTSTTGCGTAGRSVRTSS